MECDGWGEGREENREVGDMEKDKGQSKRRKGYNGECVQRLEKDGRKGGPKILWYA